MLKQCGQIWQAQYNEWMESGLGNGFDTSKTFRVCKSARVNLNTLVIPETNTTTSSVLSLTFIVDLHLQ